MLIYNGTEIKYANIFDAFNEIQQTEKKIFFNRMMKNNIRWIRTWVSDSDSVQTHKLLIFFSLVSYILCLSFHFVFAWRFSVVCASHDFFHSYLFIIVVGMLLTICHSKPYIQKTIHNTFAYTHTIHTCKHLHYVHMRSVVGAHKFVYVQSVYFIHTCVRRAR